MTLPYFDRNPAIGTPLDFELINKAVSDFSKSSNNKSNLMMLEAISSRFIDREPPVGTRLQGVQTSYVVDKTFTKGGAYISLLIPTNSEATPLLACRGMAFRRAATSGFKSGLNGLTLDFGFLGAYANLDDIDTYLQEKKIERLNIIGKSLGGAHAQYLSLLLPQKIDLLFTHASPGIGKDLKRANRVIILRQDGDGVPFVGGSHLEGKNETRIYSIKPIEEEWTPANEGTFAKLWRFFTSFSKAHVRQTTLQEFDVKEIPADEMDQALKKGETFEKVRKVVAWIFHFFTFGCFNRPRFEEAFKKSAAGALSENPLQQALEEVPTDLRPQASNA